MGVDTEKYIRKPLYVDAVRVTPQNFDELASWCQGEVGTDESPDSGIIKKYIKVRVHQPKNLRQTKAFVGDWLLYTERGYKVYTHKAFLGSFDLVEDNDGTPESEPRDNADNPVGAEKPFGDTPLSEDEEALIETDNLSLENGQPIEEAEPVEEEPIEDPPLIGEDHEDEQPVPEEEIELVEATPQAIADAVNEQEEPVSEQPPEVAAAGKRVLSEEEQRQMGPDEVRELVSTGEVILAQDLETEVR